MKKPIIHKYSFPVLTEIQQNELQNIKLSRNKDLKATPCSLIIDKNKEIDIFVIEAQEYSDNFGNPNDPEFRDTVIKRLKHNLLPNDPSYIFRESKNRISETIVDRIYKFRGPQAFDGLYERKFIIEWSNGHTERYCLASEECIELYKLNYPVNDIIDIRKIDYRANVENYIHMENIILYGDYKAYEEQF